MAFSFFQGLSRTCDGLMIAEMDLNLCRQIKDRWCLRVSHCPLAIQSSSSKISLLFQMTQRLRMYADAFHLAASPEFKPQVVKEDNDDEDQSFKKWSDTEMAR